jgi:hypothetical protein
LRTGLFTYHAYFATSEYFARALSRARHDVVRVGLTHPTDTRHLAPVQELPSDVDALVFVDPPGPAWPAGWENHGAATIAYLIDVHQGLDVRLLYALFFDRVFVAQKDYLPHFAAAGHEGAEWLPLACDEDLHMAPAQREFEVGFVGKAGPGGTRRNAVLTEVLGKFRTNDAARWYTPAGRCL